MLIVEGRRAWRGEVRLRRTEPRNAATHCGKIVLDLSVALVPEGCWCVLRRPFGICVSHCLRCTLLVPQSAIAQARQAAHLSASGTEPGSDRVRLRGRSVDGAAHGRPRHAADDRRGHRDGARCSRRMAAPSRSRATTTATPMCSRFLPTGGVPFRVTYHPAADFAVAWTPDGKDIVFRSNASSQSRYTQLYEVPAKGGIAKVLPLPMAYQGQFSPDGKQIAYSPLPPAYGFDYMSYVSWGNYHGGRASTIWVTTLPGLESVQIPARERIGLQPGVCGRQDLLSLRAQGPRRRSSSTIRRRRRTVTQALENDGPDIRTLPGEGDTLVYDRLGEIYLYDTATGHEPPGPDRDRCRHARGAAAHRERRRADRDTRPSRRPACAR